MSRFSEFTEVSVGSILVSKTLNDVDVVGSKEVKTVLVSIKLFVLVIGSDVQLSAAEV